MQQASTGMWWWRAHLQVIQVLQEACERLHSRLGAQADVTVRDGYSGAHLEAQEASCDGALQQLPHPCTLHVTVTVHVCL